MNDTYGQLILALVAILLTINIWNLTQRYDDRQIIDERLDRIQAFVIDIDQDVHELTDMLEESQPKQKKR